jgi:PKHD-type hydroxylase
MNFQNIYVQPENDPQQYYWFEKGFTPAELNKIYNDVAAIPFEKATVIGGKETEIDKTVRSSSIKWIPQSNEWSWLYDKLTQMASEANEALWGFDLISAPESIQYTEYYADQEGHYTWHQDIGNGMASRRKVSITVQLSDADEYEGGDLELWGGGEWIRQAPRGKGNVVVFPSYLMHRVKPVTKGTRRSFVLWVGGQHYK